VQGCKILVEPRFYRGSCAAVVIKKKKGRWRNKKGLELNTVKGWGNSSKGTRNFRKGLNATFIVVLKKSGLSNPAPSGGEGGIEEQPGARDFSHASEFHLRLSPRERAPLDNYPIRKEITKQKKKREKAQGKKGHARKSLRHGFDKARLKIQARSRTAVGISTENKKEKRGGTIRERGIKVGGNQNDLRGEDLEKTETSIFERKYMSTLNAPSGQEKENRPLGL